MKLPAIITLLSGAYVAHGNPLLVSTCATIFVLIISSNELGYRNDNWVKLTFSGALSVVLSLHSVIGLLSFAYPASMAFQIWRDNKVKNKLRKDVKSNTVPLKELEEEPECDE